MATKSPWPPRDGGRLVASLTIEALAERGHLVTVVTPAEDRDQPPPSTPGIEVVSVPAPTRWKPLSLLDSALTGQAYSMVQHKRPSVRHAVADLLASRNFDVIHAEQIQATASLPPTKVPVVLRTQNVESSLWRQIAESPGSVSPLARGMFRRQASRLARAEARVVGSASIAIALTEPDARTLEALSKRKVVHLPAPFPGELPAGPALPGNPALIALGDPTWIPNRDGVRMLTGDLWPLCRRALPGAHLHLFGHPGPAIDGVTRHPAPDESIEAFAAGAILLVPLRIASGVRMKILEGWARGLPVVATSEAAAGLADEGGAISIADIAAELSAAVERLSRQEEYGTAKEAGQAALVRHHDAGKIGSQLGELYNQARDRGLERA